MAIWIILGIIVLALIFIGIIIYYYNRFIVLGYRIDNAWAQIDVQLKKRADLVPNLVEAVKGYMKHERGIMKEVTDARKEMLAAKEPAAKVKAGNHIAAALKSIFAIAENYPKLQASENFKALQEELSAIENKVAYARQHYNDSVLSYNNTIKTFPGNVFASIYHKEKREWLEIASAERAVVKVKF